MLNCDDKAGSCTLENSETKFYKHLEDIKYNENTSLYYIGDPMCSWCWGFSNILKEVQTFCTNNSIKFEIKLGGLRPGGGDLWNEDFKNFLRNEWQKISLKTNQKFIYTIFEKQQFNYDTMPSCKAIFVARKLLNKDSISEDNNKILMDFFSTIQENFYALGKDPTDLSFYKSICEKYNISFEEFSKEFLNEKLDIKLYDEFNEARNLGLGGMPSLILVKNNTKYNISRGYDSFENIKIQLNKYL